MTEPWWVTRHHYDTEEGSAGLARTKLNLDAVDLSRLGTLVHGAYGVGKTHFEGDFLRYYRDAGKTVRFINIKGEDGYLTLAKYGLGECGETVDTVEDFNAAVDDAQKAEVYALAVDSLPAFADLQFRKFCGGELRYPDPVKDGQRAQMLWGQIKMATKAGVLRTRSAAPYVLWVAAHDKSVDTIEDTGGKAITPNLVGAQARESIGWFDFVLHMRAQTEGPGKVRRYLEIAPDERVATRQRLPKAITKQIGVPEGGGGWAAFLKEVQIGVGAAA